MNIRKILAGSLAAVMTGATMGFGVMAASYPAPFTGSTTALVYGSTAAPSDSVALVDIANNLNSKLNGDLIAKTPGTPVIGEAYPIFTGSSELFLNSTLNSARESVTDTGLPTVLADDTFEGVVTTTFEQRILVGSNPQIKYAQQPTDDDDPTIGITLGTSATTQYVYNATITFDQAVNFSHADSQGEGLKVLNQQLTTSAATTSTKLVFLKSSQTISLNSDDTPSQTVTVDGKTYTVELISSTDTAATIKVTNSEGKSESKEVNEAASKKISGLEVAVDNADENNFRLTASIIVGSDRITLQDGTAVKLGVDEDLVDGTNVEFEDNSGSSTTSTHNITKIIYQVAAKDTDVDGLKQGAPFVDPVFGTFKIDFTGVNIPENSDDRETITVKNAGNDKMTVTFQSHDGEEAKTINWAFNKTNSQQPTALAGTSIDLADSDGDTFSVAEMALVNKSGYVILADDSEGGGLYEVTQVSNSSSTTASDDEITLKNVMTGESISAKATTEGSATFNFGKTYTVNYYGAATISNSKAMQIRVNQPETSGNQQMLWSTVKTAKGAKVAFYEPLNLSLDNWDGSNNDPSAFLVPDGDGYTTVTVTKNTGGGVKNGSDFNITTGSGQATTEVNASQAQTATIGKITLNFTTTGEVSAAVNQTQIYLVSPEGGNIVRPALIVFEEKDDASNYEAFIVTLDAGYDGDSAGIGVSDVVRTWGSDAADANEIQHETDTDLYSDMDIWGTVFTLDKSDSDQTTATISYPDDQVEAMVYVAEVGASSTDTSSTPSTVGELGNIAVTDAEALTGKNVIAVGGPCVNTEAATLLGSSTPLCGADFTAATGVGPGQFLIQSFDKGNGKIGLVVAGYSAQDTTNAGTYLSTQTVDTTVGNKYVGTSATEASLVTEE